MKLKAGALSLKGLIYTQWLLRKTFQSYAGSRKQARVIVVGYSGSLSRSCETSVPSRALKMTLP